MQKALFRFGWVIIALFAVFLFGMTSVYFSFRPDINFLNEKQDVLHNWLWRSSFYIHIAGGMLALLVGPFQFIPRLRNARRQLHRSMGKIYVGSILFAGGPAGLFMAFYAEGGWFSSLGFAVMAVLWLVTTFLALETVRKGDIVAHRAWITRSFALTFAAVTLRIYVPLASWGLGLDPHFVVVSSAWVSWLPNLLVAELLIQRAARSL
jgi:uncharacterized membrane protein